LAGEVPVCPVCRSETEVYSRVVGYLRPVGRWNDGKQEEYHQRRSYKVPVSVPALTPASLPAAAAPAAAMAPTGGLSVISKEIEGRLENGGQENVMCA
jgi:hypothetical protein